MIHILARLFIKDKDTSKPSVQNRYAILCTITGIVLNVFMFSGKLAAGIIGHSAAITADAYNNLGDAVTNIETLAGLHFAEIGADMGHPGGHGRMEWIIALLAGYAVLTMGLSQLWNAILTIWTSSPLQVGMLQAVTLSVSILVKLYMWYYNRSIGRDINFLSLKAVASDSLSDAAATLTVLVSCIVQALAGWEIDGWCSVAVSCLIIKAGIASVHDAVVTILGLSPDENIVRQVEHVVHEHGNFSGIRDLMVHDYGYGRKFITFHLTTESPVSLDILCSEADIIANTIRSRLGCSTMICVERESRDLSEAVAVRESLGKILPAMKGNPAIDECRIVEFTGHKDVYITLTVPRHEHNHADDYAAEVAKNIAAMDSGYVPVVRVVLK